MKCASLSSNTGSLSTFIVTSCYLGHLTQRVVPSNAMTGSTHTSQASETNLI